jgi:hypothetical protein
MDTRIYHAFFWKEHSCIYCAGVWALSGCLCSDSGLPYQDVVNNICDDEAIKAVSFVGSNTVSASYVSPVSWFAVLSFASPIWQYSALHYLPTYIFTLKNALHYALEQLVCFEMVSLKFSICPTFVRTTIFYTWNSNLEAQVLKCKKALWQSHQQHDFNPRLMCK